MDASNDSLLHRLIDASVSEDNARADFGTAMQRMGLASVFDVMRMGKAKFILELSKHTDVDGGQAYENAASFAQQVSRLFQEHLIAPGNARQRTRRSLASGSTSTSVSYQALFNERWDQFCKEGDIAAIDSPVAYLRALYLFAGQLENASPSSDKITLKQRRPDLTALMLDQQSAFVARPMLEIVNDTLRSAIEAHLATTGRTVHQVLASEHYPFSLPYDLHHHQCLLGLDAGRPALGELNYRVSLQLPFSPGDSPYGRVSQSHVEAQKLLSGLSPEQQKLLLAPASSDLDLGVLKKNYGTEDINRLHDLSFFKERTGLTTEQVEQLLAQGPYSPRVSTNSPPSTFPSHGAGYINGSESEPALAISKASNAFAYGSRERFARLQRMIRLHRWTGIPVADLDTLLVNALRSESSTTMTLDANTLRTLGVYRYLNQRHGIAPQEFASLLHDMPISACGPQVSLFDQVFNRTRLLEHPPAQDLVTTDPKTLSYLSAGLGLAVTQDSLLWLIKQTEKYLPSFKYDLSTLSSLYRQARIARMFGLTPVECTALAHLLGGEEFCKALVTGALSPSHAPQPDILDVLMALDWAVDWLKEGTREVAPWCRLFDAIEGDLPMNKNMERRLSILLAEDRLPSGDRHVVETLLHDFVDLSADYASCVMQLADTHATTIVAAIEKSPGAMPALLATVLRTAQACKAMHLSSSTLRQLLNNPSWLAANHPGTLTPQTLYLLDRFSHCAQHQARSEEHLLHYLQLANQDTTQGPAEEANKLLASLLDWSTDEVSCLTAQLEHKRAQSMETVDWVMRCQACCQRTGLSASLLLQASALNSDSQASDWRTVGEALIAARH